MSVNRKSPRTDPLEPASLGSPEVWLRKASHATDPTARAKYATSGLGSAQLEGDTQLLLMRQLCLSHLERGRPHDAREVALQMVRLGEWPEMAHQEAARAYTALGDFSAGIEHLRLAGRAAPASRRGFHLWCLGSALYATGQHAEAADVLARAQRWAIKDKAVVAALLVLCQRALGQAVDLSRAYSALSEMQSSPGVADWIGGELLFKLGRSDLAEPLLRAFVARNANQPAKAAGLRAELEHVRRLLAECNKSRS